MSVSEPVPLPEAEARVEALRRKRAESPEQAVELSAALLELSGAYEQADRGDAALAAAKSGVEALASAFLAAPGRFAAPMRAIVAKYVALAGRSRTRADEGLLAPIAQALGDLERRADADDD